MKKSASSRRFATLTLGAVPVVLLGGLISIDHIPGTDISLTVPYAAEGPGPTVDTLSEVEGKQVVDVQAPQVDDPAGQLNMTTVSVRSHMTLSQALSRWLLTDDTLVPIEQVIPPNHSPEEVEEANAALFLQSESAATLAAMDYLDKPVKVVVAQVLDDGAAKDAVALEDVIRAIDGQAVTKPQQVQNIIRSKKPGDEVTLEVENKSGDKREEKVILGEHPRDKKIPMLGISMTSAPEDDIKVSYNLQDIGGPSAGMMFTLAVVDKLEEGDLTGGKFVAGTGTIDEDGKVGEIGGIVHKVRASKDAGAELFLAPDGNCAEATSRDYGDMTIAKVATLDDAIKAMEDFAAGRPVATCD